MSVSAIHDLVCSGQITPEQGALLLELRREVQRRRRRRIFWRGVLDGMALGPVWRWVRRRWP